jgi:ferredoxin
MAENPRKSGPAEERTVFVCDCEGTMPLDRKAIAKAGFVGEVIQCTHLCRSEIERFTGVIADEHDVLVACTQEAPLFEETAAEADAPARIRYTNIRERAGWSEAAKGATPKILALLAEAQLEAPLNTMVTLKSEGSVLVYGEDADAIEAARQLADRMDVTCLMRRADDLLPPRVARFALYRGEIAGAGGWLGAYEVTVKALRPSEPSARGALGFAERGDDALLRFDIVLDLTREAALVTGHEHRDGYFKPDPGNPAAVQKALYEITNLIGEFEKPRYVTYDESICVHSRNRITGCSRCLDGCPAGAITSDGERVVIEPHICGGCGVCASVCPTGAVSYVLPPIEFLTARLRTLLDAYRTHGGKTPVLLVHDTDHGEEMIAVMARAGRGLPAHVIPFAVNEVTQVGLDFFASAFAYGASEIALLVGPKSRDDLDGLKFQITLAETFLDGLGYGAGRIALIEESDPDAVAEALYAGKPPKAAEAGNFQVLGGKRSASDLALNHLHQHAPKPVDLLALPAGAPFGDIEVAAAGCTMCLSCVSACPTGAFRDDPDSPTLRFVERACVQCGLCRVTCPEKVITLKPRYNFQDSVGDSVLKKEEEPFNCVRCGTAFGVKSSIERMVEKLAGHAMFKDETALNRIRMCIDCRVIDMAEAGGPDFGGTPRPKTRTTEDYLREEAEAAAAPGPRRGNGKG